jgi:hypothetical protein
MDIKSKGALDLAWMQISKDWIQWGTLFLDVLNFRVLLPEILPFKAKR